MKLCDLTLAYTEVSGGIRTYIDQKRKYILGSTDHEHVLIVPWSEDVIERADRLVTIKIKSPVCPGCQPYRMFVRPERVLAALRETGPDVVELASFFLAPWAAFWFRNEVRATGGRSLVSGYFHTDLAEAYIGAPFRRVAGGKASGLARKGAEAWFGRIFRKCDLLFAATDAQADRLRSYGINGPVGIIPLGVDINLFNPRHRSNQTRRMLGVADEHTLLIYGGRLDREKHVDVLIEAFQRLPEGKYRLVVCGEGAERETLIAKSAEVEGISIRPYEKNKGRFAAMLASADVYVTAGPHETFGLSIVEAQASGLPVVGVDSGAVVERVSPDVGRLGPVDDAAAFAENIEYVAERRSEMGAAARRLVESAGYGWEGSFEKLMGLYSEALR